MPWRNHARVVAGAGRDLRLDTLRGFMLVAMAVNHLDTELRVLTDHAFGFVSTAEGFVFLSGFVAGMVYTRRALRSPHTWRHQAWHRAGQIYCHHLASLAIAVAGLLLLNFLTPTPPGTLAAFFIGTPGLAFGLASVLLYQPGLFDILPMYCAFMLALPAIIGALRAGRARWLVAISAGLWLLAQTTAPAHAESALKVLLPVNLGAFDMFAWQLLFTAGAYLGYHRSRSTALFSFRPAMLLFCLLLAVPLWMWKNEYLPLAALPFDIWAWTDKSHLAPLRLVNFIVIAYLIAAVAVRRPEFFKVRPLAFLGQHSLPVYAFQVTLSAFVLSQPHLFTTFGRRTTIALAMIGLLFLPAWLHASRRPPRPPAPSGTRAGREFSSIKTIA